MRLAVCIAVVIAVSVLGGLTSTAEDENAVKPDAGQQNFDPQGPDRPVIGRKKSKDLELLRQEVGRLVHRYYPDADVASYYDPKSKTDKIHFEVNTQIFFMRFRGDDGQWQKPVPIRGPYVGGIWCDLELVKGRYRGKLPDAEEGTTALRPEYYSRWVAPYSKKLDRHLMVALRFPGGTPTAFLKRFDALVKGFEGSVGKPAAEEDDATGE
jgi:hypothetical protein